MHIDVTSAIGAEVREVRHGERDGAETWVQVVSRFYDTDRADLWDALTSKERIPRWFMPITGELRPGGFYQFEGNAGGTILQCDPPQMIEITWEFGGGVSWVILRLAETEPGRTQLVLEHVARKADIAEFWSQYGPGATGVGWDLGFLGLGLHIDSGEPVPPEANAEWMESDNYRQFVSASSTAWGDAAIAAGETGDQARTAAEATRKFYSGEA